ncbi:MAG: putative Isoleucine--tRNA ligase [Streblomastix strix]|uniref:Putative Isoleucine--tRNA ligase n=1 Tax=Streblomastix strix TaxID=222440 RepID=A0A5J4WXB8_9EUKA|nr:MAG: putative Isoleucine--tRNA ligase [Streblomastix strix]
MSKRLKNYPDPVDIVNRHGADAIRLYLISSPAVHADDLAFKEEGVQEIIRRVLIPWYNAVRFFEQYTFLFNQKVKAVGSESSSSSQTAGNDVEDDEEADEKEQSTYGDITNLIVDGVRISEFKRNADVAHNSTNVMDHWIMAETDDLLSFIQREMKKYNLFTVVPQSIKYIESLTNWYIRLNRRRLKGLQGPKDWHESLCVLFEVLHMLSIVMAPFTPFICEKMYQDLKKYEDEKDQLESVHYSLIPGEKPIYAHDKSEKEENENEQTEQVKDNSGILRAMNSMQRVILLGRQIRDKEIGISLKIPLERVVTVTHNTQERNDINQLAEYIKDELNVRLFQTQDANEFIVDETTGENVRFLQLKCQVQMSIGKKAKVIFDEERTKGIGYNGNAPRTIKQILDDIQNETSKLEEDQIVKLESGQVISVAGVELTQEDVIITRSLKPDPELCDANDGVMFVRLSRNVTQDSIAEGKARTIVSKIQNYKKIINLVPSDRVKIYIRPTGRAVVQIKEKKEGVESKKEIKDKERKKLAEEKKAKRQETKKDKGNTNENAKIDGADVVETDWRHNRKAKKDGSKKEEVGKKDEIKEKEKEKEEPKKKEIQDQNFEQLQQDQTKTIQPGPVIPRDPEADVQSIAALEELLKTKEEMIRRILRHDVHLASAMEENSKILGTSAEEVDEFAFDIVVTKDEHQ